MHYLKFIVYKKDLTFLTAWKCFHCNEHNTSYQISVKNTCDKPVSLFKRWQEIIRIKILQKLTPVPITHYCLYS
jgi:hypothetical protein